MAHQGELFLYPRPEHVPHELAMANNFAYNGSGKNPVPFTDLDACRARIGATIQGQGDLALLLKDVEFYFERWYVFTTVVENDRTRHRFQGMPLFSWYVPSSERVYRHSCLRFETIMSGVLYASILFNLGVRGESENVPSVRYFFQAYVVLRHVCHAQICAWQERDEYDLPLESTEPGCVLLEMICLFKIQHNALQEAFERTSKQGSGAANNLFYQTYARMSLWMLTECAEVEQRLCARKKDGSLFLFPWMEIIGSYHMEALGLYFLWNVKYAMSTYGADQKRDENLRMLWWAQQSVDKFLRGESRFRRWHRKKKREGYANEIASTRIRLERLKDALGDEAKAQKDTIALGLPSAYAHDTERLGMNPWDLVHVREPLFVKTQNPGGLETYTFHGAPSEMYHAMFPASTRPT